VLHAERDAKRLVRVALGDIEEHKEWEEKLVRRITEKASTKASILSI